MERKFPQGKGSSKTPRVFGVGASSTLVEWCKGVLLVTYNLIVIVEPLRPIPTKGLGEIEERMYQLKIS